MAPVLDAVTEQGIVLPAALAQERLWFLDRLKPGMAVYNMPWAIRLPAVHRAVLNRCFTELVRRHESLRTTFATDGVRPVQVVAPPRPFEVALVDLRRYPRREREARLRALSEAESRRPFELARGPLLRATLYRLAADDHLLLIVMHHIISDAWSIEVLTRELGTLYAAFDAGAPSPLEPLEIQYADWASWQRDRLDSGVLDAGLAFWKARLAGAPTVLDLPTDRARPRQPSYLGGTETFIIEPQLAERLRVLSQRHGCTLFMTLLAAYGTMLGRYAGKSDVLVGSPLTNRDRPELEPVIGLFVNTVVLRVDFRDAPTVAGLLERVRAMMLDGHPHSEVPLEKLIEVMQPERSAGRHPLFQVLFSLHASAARVTAAGVPASGARGGDLRPPNTGTAKFDLSLLMTESAGGLGGTWEYSADLFEVTRIRRMTAHFTRLLQAFVDSPEERVRDLPMMDEAELREIASFERRPRAGTGAACVHERIAAQARRTPHAIAVEAGPESLTYAQLVGRANALAERLRTLGIGPDQRVGVFMRRRADLVTALLAIHSAGGAYVPLDPAHPRDRLAYIAEDAQLTWIVTDPVLTADLPPGVKPVYVDGAGGEHRQAAAAAPAAVLPGNLAYVLYTSGTTGRPKGVAVPHGCVSAMLDWASVTFGATEYARMLASTSICFDISVFELFLPLLHGGTVVLVENVLALASPSPPDVTLINTVPSAMRELLRIWRPGPSLRTVNLAGEALPRDLVQRLHEQIPHLTVYNLYGPTETTVYSTGARISPEDPSEPTIGGPIEGESVYVLDEHLERVPIGVPGELYIGGAGVARGYLRRPALTAERYLPDPFAARPGARMYRTSDLVCWRDDGRLEFRGRADHQVKLRGYRIELGEIESALRKHPRVRDAVVVMRRPPSGDAQLVGYVIMDEPAVSELDALMRRELPAYMAPSRLVFLDELPRTATGKVDRAALPPPDANEPGQAAGREPADGTEAALCELFASLLGVTGFDVDGDFFAAGGHSLLATGVVARANELLGVQLPLSAIFEHPTPARLAAFLGNVGRSSQAARVPPPPLRSTSDDGPLPLSFAQRGLWFYHRLRPRSALYNIPVILPAGGAIDLPVLQRSVDFIVSRHDAFRMCFEMAGGEPVQRLIEDARVKVVLHDLSGVPPLERRDRAQRLLEREVQRPFDLRRAPLLRASLVRLSPDEQLIVLVMHHIISDGWSTDILQRDFATAYQAYAMGASPTLAEPSLRYGDYVRWQRGALTPTVVAEHIAYFREQLAGAPALLKLPTDHPRPPQPSFRGGMLSFDIDTAASAALAKVAAARGATQQMAYLAVLAALLHQYAGEEDVVVGIAVANRSRPEWRDVIGLFTNTLPLRIACGRKPTFVALLERVREAAVGAYAHEELPFDQLVQELSPARDLAHNPIFQVMLGFQELEGSQGGDSGGSTSSGEVLTGTGTAKFDLSLALSRRGGRVSAVLEYASDLFEPRSMERLVRRYRRLVEALAAKPDAPLDEIAPLDDEERVWREASRASAPRLPGEGSAEAAAASAGKQADMAPLAAAPIAARTDLERQIAEIWTEALGHSRFGVDQSFFEVGGHSLAAVSVIVRVAEKWGVELPFERIFAAPTIAALARAVEEAPSLTPSADGGDAVELRSVERTGAMPLSFAQERLWFLEQMAPGLPVYNISFPIFFPGAVDVRALERSLERLGDRHECLRARFVAGESGPEQVHDPVMAVDLRVTDLSNASPTVRNTEIERVQSREARRSFDLSTGPLLRTHLLRLSPRDHVLLVTIHHILADARSVDILQRDLAALYEDERGGRREALPELRVQYADFAVWQRAWLRGDRLAAELAHWKQTLAGAPPVLVLPTDRPRPSEQSHAGTQLPLSLGAEASADIRRLAAEEQATPFMVLLAIYAAVLGRWSGATDLVIGTPVIGRPHRDLEDLIGFFSNTLPIRIALDGHPTFRALLRHVRGVVIDAFSHQDLPFEAIVQGLQPERTLAHNPLFQVMFAFQRPGLEPQGGRQRGVGGGSGTSKFDLTLFLVDEDELHGAIEYATDLFDAATIERLSHHIRAATAAAAAPDAALADMVLASPADRAAIDGWNANASRFASGEALAHELFAEQAARTPSAPAVSSETGTWSYTELMRRASSLAARLREHGVGPDSRVVIAADPSPELVAAVLGVWFAGGACVPLDPSYPAARLSFMAENSGTRWLVRTRRAKSVIDSLGLIPIEPADCDDAGAAPRAAAMSADQLAYVVYTSGSTGTPKGVAMCHRQLVNLVLWQRGLDGRGGPRRTAQFSSPSFDVFFQELLLTLATGGELVIAAPDVRRDPALLIQLCREKRIERLFMPFVALRELAEAGISRPPLPELREVITAGEQLQVTRALRRWFTANPGCRLFNQYGPSETHVVTEEALDADPATWSTLPPIGRPIANDRVYILDAALRPLPVGVPGDLYLGGIGVARGYLDRPALTAERFLPDPYGGPGARMYRSGDRARWLADGRVEFLGRNDDQVKIRGYRIELAEVESALTALPRVRQAVVAAKPASNGEKHLVGYVLSDDPNADPTALRNALLGVLPEPLVPAVLVLVSDLPRTPSGKVDRRALPAPVSEPRAVRMPTNELERIIADIWCDVLGVEQVGLDDNFFSLGGHSLLATRVAARLQERLGEGVPVRTIFEHPTIERLAAATAAVVARPQNGAASSAAPVTELAPLPRDGSPLPASFAQERLWFLDRLVPGSPAYNLASVYALPPSLDVDALRGALNELVRRHEALRTVFHDVGGRPVQLVMPAKRATLDLIDLSYLPEREADAEARRHGEEEARRSFDLDTGPLFRATLLDLGRSGYRLMMSMHHIISDGWSLKILHRDLVRLYEALERGGRPALPPLRVQYADFAAWQRTTVTGPVLDGLLSYWRTHLAGAPHRLELPTDRPRSNVPSSRGGSHSFELDAEHGRALMALGQEEGATLFMTVLAIYLELLSRHARQHDFLVGTPVGARPRPELEEVVGLFVNTLVLRAQLEDGPSFRALVRRVREETLGAYSHADLPFERLVEELQPRRSLGFNALIQVAFGLHHAGADGTAGGESMSGNGTTKFELSLVMTESNGRLAGVFEYDQDLFEPATIARMASHFEQLARQAVRAPDAPLSRCELVLEAEAREVGRWARGPQRPAESDLTALIARRARLEPTLPAVEAPDGALTYAEFDATAASLAGTLRALGVGPEVRVGVCLGNSKQLPVSLLAIWRAGGAYIPLDPALPLARQMFLVRDAEIGVILTDSVGAERFAGCGATIVRVDAHDGAPSGDAPVAPLDPDRLAYVIYTSGSTGQPKGVMVTHRGLRALVAAQAHTLGLRPGDRVLKFATLSFDASIFEMVGALAAGATLCLEDPHDLLPRPELVTLLRRREITMITLPPSSLGMLPVEALPALRLLFVAGEACTAELVARWAPGRRMINGYGPTETTVWATYADCVADGRRPAIGKPVANAVVRIVDRHLQPVPAGIPGELCISGPAVARGYLGRPELTAASFIPDPWGPPGARMYRTGDLVRWRADGSIDFLGRIDGQIKLRGVRIEPSEIEAAITALPGVAYCAVVLRDDQPGNPQLVAYVVQAPQASLEGSAIRRALQEQLPRFLVPSRVVICAELPRTPSGKLDRNALPAPPSASDEAAAPPRSTLEEAVFRICAEILGVRVSRDDNFFELGGHSLLLTRVLSRVRDELGIDVPVRRMYEAPTMAAFCEGFALREPGTSSKIPRLPRRQIQ
jgi:amino acid adenylation domain-containing protein